MTLNNQERRDQELAEQLRDRRHYLFSDECYGQRVRDNDQEMAAMWRAGTKWGGLASLAVFAFFAAIGAPAGGALLGICLFAFVCFPLMVGSLFGSLFPGWRGLF